MLDLNQSPETMSQAVRPPTGSGGMLLVSYVGTVALIITLAIVGHWFISGTLDQSTQHAALINLAGRQRMYSQQIAKDVQILANPDLAYRHDDIRAELTGHLDDWQRAHDILVFGDIQLDLPVGDKGEFNDVMTQAREHMDVMVDSAESVIFRPGNFDSVKDVVERESNYLPLAEHIVELLETRAAQTNEAGEKIVVAVLGSTLLIVLLELAIVFYPMIRSLNRLRQQLESVGDAFMVLFKERVRQQNKQAQLDAIDQRDRAAAAAATANPAETFDAREPAKPLPLPAAKAPFTKAA